MDSKIGIQNTVDISRVETEEDTSEGGESTHEVRLDGDGRFDAVRVGRSHDSTTGHDGRVVVGVTDQRSANERGKDMD